jgi:hypothetical protein
MAAQFEPIVGRYMTLELGGRPHRIYFEQAGEGFPSFACTRPAPTGASSAT